MKSYSKTIAAIICFIFMTADLFGQAQITTRREKLKDFTVKTTKIVLTGDALYDQALREAAVSAWTISPFELCSLDEFNSLKTSDNYYFLLTVQGKLRKETEPGIDMLTVVKGGCAAGETIDDMLEVATFPVKATGYPSGREFVLLPALLHIIQNHISELSASELSAYSGFEAKDSDKLKTKRIYFWEEDFAPMTSEKAIRSLDEDIIVCEDEEEVDDVFSDGTLNAVVSYVVGPSEASQGSVCYKMLIGADNHELYYFKKHKITARNGNGFLDSDLKSIRSKRK